MTRSELETAVCSLIMESGITTQIFKQDTRDPNYQGEYIEIIPLEFDEQRLIANSVVNVNVHVPDINGLKDSQCLDTLSDQIRPIFRQSKDASESYYTIYQRWEFSIVSTNDYAEGNNTHFRNFKINVTYLNL